MRTTWFFLVLFLVGCSSDAWQPRTRSIEMPAPGHAPELFDVDLSVEEASFMEGDGHVAVSADIYARDAGLDIVTVRIEMSDGVTLSLDVSGLLNDVTGTIWTPEFDVATTAAGPVTMDVWLVDAAGDSSDYGTTMFVVKGDPYTWMERVTGLPTALNSVAIKEGRGFVAVGDEGTIMTSEDGLTWTDQVSGTNVDLNFVTCLPESMLSSAGCIVVGDEGTLLVASGFDDWKTGLDVPDDVSLHWYDPGLFDDDFAFGTMTTTDVAVILRFDHNDLSWTSVEPLAQSGQRITDLEVGRWYDEETLDVLGNQFVATVDVPFPEQAKVLVSDDFLTWVEVFVSDSHGSTYSIEGKWVGGTGGRIYASDDGINWTQYATPADQSNLVALVTDDGMVMAHGFSETIGLGEQVGVATSDDGETWQTFVIGAAYEPRGLAYGHGRWVSVGQSLAEPGKGAIFTTQ